MATFKLATAAALLFGQATASPQAQMFEKRQVGGEEPDVIIPGASSYNGLNLVPQMGWNNWNAFHCDVNESLLLTTAQDMVDYGLRDLGYNYIVLDDCWAVGSKFRYQPTSKPLYTDKCIRKREWLSCGR